MMDLRQLEVQVARQDERMEALVEKFTTAVGELRDAFKEHIAEDRAAHARVETLVTRVDVQAKVTRRLWTIAITGAGAGSAIVAAASHLLGH